MKHEIINSGLKPALLAAIGCGFVLGHTTETQAQTLTNEPPKWQSSAAAGLTLTRGNSKTVLGTINIQSQRKTAGNEILLGADAAYGEDNGVKNTDTLNGFGQYNYLLTPRWYVGLRLDAMRDTIAAIDYRFTLAPLAGYYFIKEKNTTLAAEAGPGFIYEKKGGQTQDYATLRLAERLEHKFSETAKLWQSVEILPQVTRFGNFIVNGEIGVETGLTKTVSLRTYIQDTYYNEPAPGRQKNDFKLVTAIAYKF